jgi:hypothetical protein
LRSKQKSRQVPWTAHDVGDIVGLCDFIGCTNKRKLMMATVVTLFKIWGETIHTMKWT